MERCRLEIAVIEAEIVVGNPDLAQLCVALTDWSMGLRIIQDKPLRRTHSDGAEGNISKLTGHRGVIVYEEFRTCDP